MLQITHYLRAFKNKAAQIFVLSRRNVIWISPLELQFAKEKNTNKIPDDQIIIQWLIHRSPEHYLSYFPSKLLIWRDQSASRRFSLSLTEYSPWTRRSSKVQQLQDMMRHYLKNYPAAEPVEEFDDRNRLCNLKSNLNYSAGHPGSIMRQS